MTRDELGQLLERLRPPFLPPKLQALTARYRFKLDNGESWDFLLDRGRLSLGNAGGPPETMVECSPEEFLAILSGKHNFLTAFMRGDVRIQGTVPSAKNLYTWLRYAQPEEAKT